MTIQSDNHFLEIGEDFIAHIGKKGMKWGVRTESPNSGSKTNPYSNRKAIAKSVAKNVAKTAALVTINAGAGYAFGLLGVVGAQTVTAVVRNQITINRLRKAEAGNKFAQKKLKTKVSRAPNRLGVAAGVGGALTFAALRMKDLMNGNVNPYPSPAPGPYDNWSPEDLTV